MLKYFSVSTLFIVLLLTSDLPTAQAQGMPTPQVQVETLEIRNLSPIMKIKGNVLSVRDAIIASEISAQLTDITEVGVTVSKGQSVAKLDLARLNWQVQKSEADITRLQADLEFRKSEVERFTTLAKRDNASKTQLQLELARRAMLEQEIQIAKLNLQEAKLEKSNAQFFAPFSGVVAERFADIGEYIQQGTPLVRLVDIQNTEVDAAVPAQMIFLLQNLEAITIETATSTMTLPVSKVIPVSDPQTRMAKIRLDATDSGLVVGQAVTLSVPKQLPEKRVAIPRDALVIRGSNTFVYFVDESSTAKQVQVNVIYADDQWIATEESFEVGQQVIIRGAERLQPGSPVEVMSNL